MKKAILLSSGQVMNLSFEEAREQFKPMVIKAMKVANNKFIYNQVEEQDFMQIMEVEFWKAYRDYDSSMGNCFTTYLYSKLKKGVRDATYYKYSQKNQGTTVSMNAPKGADDLKLEDMFASLDDSTSSMDVRELTAIILSQVAEDEKELLQIILDVHNNPVVDYADKYGITRQAATQRVNKLKNKIRQAVKEQYLAI